MVAVVSVPTCYILQHLSCRQFHHCTTSVWVAMETENTPTTFCPTSRNVFNKEMNMKLKALILFVSKLTSLTTSTLNLVLSLWLIQQYSL